MVLEDTLLSECCSAMTIANLGGATAGGVWNFGDLTLLGVTIQFADGGGALRNDGVATVEDSSIVDNNVLIVGSAGISNSGSLTMGNSTIARNGHALSHGAYFGSGSADFTSVTITDNSDGIAGIDVTIAGSIVSGNGSLISGYDCDGTAISLGSNVVGAFTSGCGFSSWLNDVLLQTPLLSQTALISPMDNGLPGGQYYEPNPGSPAIDLVATCWTADDQIGNARPAGWCDAGSIEVP